MWPSVQHTTILYDDFLGSFSGRVLAHLFHLLDHVPVPFEHLPEDDVLSVEVRRGFGGDKELRAIGVGTSVGHAQKASLLMFYEKALVLEFATVDGLAASAVPLGEVPAL